MGKINSLLNKNKDVLFYTAINYVDKALFFILPLLVLELLNDKSTYNTIEYIYSIASIIATFVDGGGRSYYFFAYRNTENRRGLVIRKFRLFLKIVGLLLIILSVWAGVSKLLGYEWLLFSYIGVRAIYIYVSSFLNYHFRLQDKPSKIFKVTLSVSLASILIVLIWYFLGAQLPLYMYFLPMFLMEIAIIVNQKNFKPNEHDYDYVKKAFKFAWPLLINVILIALVNNYGKIYSYQNLSEQEMFELSFTLRIAFVIHIAHSSVYGFLAKKIYVNDSMSTMVSVIKQYSLFLFIAFAGAAVLLYGYIMIINDGQMFEIAWVWIFVYTLLWCYLGFFEGFLSKYNKNDKILIFTLISSAFFGAYLLYKNTGIQINDIILSMNIFIIVNLSLVLFYVKKQKIFK